MQYKTLILFITSILFVLQSVKSQTTKNHTFLQEVGILDSLYSKNLKENRNFYVQLPKDYNPSSKNKYPVVFILDGAILLPTVHNVQSFYSGGFTPEMVLVGISNANNRARDLTTSKLKNEQFFNEENGEAENFIQFIKEELIPFIESKYPVTNFRTLIGHSYGGLFTMYTLIHHPDIFSNYIAIDPSLDWDNQLLLTQSKTKLSSNNYEGKSLFMSLSGQLHLQNPQITIDNVMKDTSPFTLFARSNIKFSNLIKQFSKNGLAFKWKFYPSDLHGTIPFPSIMDGLIFDFKWYQMESTDRINSFDTPKEELLKIIRYRAQKLKTFFGYSTPPYPEDLLNMSGYMNMDMQQEDKAKMYFELAIEYYPQSANAYDSMADYYDQKKDIDNALKYASKAYKISGNDYHKKRVEQFSKKKKR